MLDGRSKTEQKNRKNKDGLTYGAPFHYQVSILLGRTWRTIWREKVVPIFAWFLGKSTTLAFHSFRDTQILTTMRFALHVCISILLGLVYWQIGDDANEIFNNSGMIFFSLIFILYVAMMPTFLTCKSIIYLQIMRVTIFIEFHYYSYTWEGGTGSGTFKSMVQSQSVLPCQNAGRHTISNSLSYCIFDSRILHE